MGINHLGDVLSVEIPHREHPLSVSTQQGIRSHAVRQSASERLLGMTEENVVGQE